MFDLKVLKGKKAYITVFENSIVILYEDEKIVFLAQPDDYEITIVPPGIRGCNQPVDEYGRVIFSDEGVFENGLPYIINDFDYENGGIIDKKEDFYSKISLSLSNLTGESCQVSLLSQRIYADVREVFDFSGFVGQKAWIHIRNNELLIKKSDTVWSFSAQPHNYIVRIEKDIGCMTIDELKKEDRRFFEDGFSCTISDIQYYDDMLGETTIEYNLYYTNLCVTVQTEEKATYCIELETEKLNISKVN